MVQNPKLIDLKEGDGVTLKVAFNKNEPKSAWIVMGVDFKKQKALLKRDSGLDVKSPQPKWIDFKLIEQIFPQTEAIYQLFLDRQATDPMEYVSNESLQRFLYDVMQLMETCKANVDEYPTFHPGLYHPDIYKNEESSQGIKSESVKPEIKMEIKEEPNEEENEDLQEVPTIDDELQLFEPLTELRTQTLEGQSNVTRRSRRNEARTGQPGAFSKYF